MLAPASHLVQTRLQLYLYDLLKISCRSSLYFNTRPYGAPWIPEDIPPNFAAQVTESGTIVDSGLRILGAEFCILGTKIFGIL